MIAPSFRHQLGKSLLAQVSFMDRGNTGVYELQVDYLKVDILHPRQKFQEKSAPIPYRPPLADESSFALERTVAADITVDQQYPIAIK